MIHALLLAAALSPAALFAQERAAVGSAWDGIVQITERGSYVAGGAPGVPYVSYVDARDGFSKLALGQDGGTMQGYDRTGSWQAADGLVQPVEDAATVASSITAAYIARNGWWHPESDPAAFEYSGRRTVAARAYDVVRVAPKGGDAVDVWLDAGTHLIAELIERNAGNVTTTTYLGDYRSVDGVKYPYSTVISDGNPKDDQVLHATSVAFASGIAAADFARPQNKRTGSIAGGISTSIPFEMDNADKGHIVLLVRVNGSRPLHMIFDTGGSNIVSTEVAREIGLKGTGATTAGGAGEGQVTVQTLSGVTMHLGDATLTSQPFGILPLPRSLVHMTSRYTVDGVIGYEVLKNFVVSIDYVKKTLTLTEPDAFDAAGAGTPIHFASATIPVIPVTYDGVQGQFMFDTGNAFYNTVSQTFLDAHSLAPATPGTVLVQSSGNLGGAFRPWLTRAKQIQIGPYRIDRPVFAVTNNAKGALAGTAFAGNLS
ncbi:MAG TPA: retroviral-like aspartic protease family protein, partial [Candidatus Acidoferrales bacterium]|nr:retroviral-like aspartic protease family protein [Candidatus Acidoferrales bacterium]